MDKGGQTALKGRRVGVGDDVLLGFALLHHRGTRDEKQTGSCVPFSFFFLSPSDRNTALP